MVIVPNDVRCNYCARTFCCLKCRVNHEKNEHQNEINMKIREEYLKSICHICRGEQLPVKINEMISSELIQHISEHHLPLKCNKCSKIFNNINDFQLIGKCCSIKRVEDEQISEEMHENMGEVIVTDMRENKCKEDALTPLTKINLRWRRKSKEFLHKSEDSNHTKNEQAMTETQLKRQTSTPVQGIFDSLSSMQFSSINCISSSSETDLSPAFLQKQPSIVVVSPKSKKKGNSPLSKSRPKLIVHNTPLRQVMTKSIQRAMATHGHYKHVHLQQRKMTFDSSSSSNEPTVSLMKLQVETEEHDSNLLPLDLRLSPALRRNNDEYKEHNKSEQVDHVQYEEIQVIYRSSDNCKENSSLVQFESCCSDIGTPKGSSSNFLKKTISFETPRMIDKTPGLLVHQKSLNNYNFNDDNDDVNDVYYTPKSTPVRRVKSLDLIGVKSCQKPQQTAKNSGNIWDFVTNVMGSLVTGKKNESARSENKKRWGFDLENPLKAAVSYFGKYSDKASESEKSSEDEEENLTYKRPRSIITSPDGNSENTPITSPICKRRKIQGRKPIDRMRKFD